MYDWTLYAFVAVIAKTGDWKSSKNAIKMAYYHEKEPKLRLDSVLQLL